jgi:6-hydroxynicotinate 3-monooxygenase
LRRPVSCSGQGSAFALYEQAEEFSRVGAGIILSANVAKVLRRLGLEEELVRAGIRPDAYVSRAWDTGDVLYRIGFDEESERRYGGPYLNIHRGDLHDVLKHAVEPGTIAMGHQLAAFEERGSGVRLRFTNGASAEFDIVIGADGIRSKVREVLLGPEPPRYIGKVAQRAIFAAERLGGAPIPDCTKWWGEDRHVLAYYMTPRRDEVYLIGVVPQQDWDSEASFLPCSTKEFRASYERWHPDLLRVVEAAEDVTVWPIYDRERDDRWTGGRIVLLGDACHPMRPFMAAGGAMAVEDAAILSRCLMDFKDRARCFPGLRGHTGGPGRRGPAHLDREQLDARPDRYGLVLLLRCLHGPVSRAEADRGLNTPNLPGHLMPSPTPAR